MIKSNNYEFLGKPDSIFPRLETGKVYLLTVKENGPIISLFKGWKIEIVQPFWCPYDTLETFMQNWRRI